MILVDSSVWIDYFNGKVTDKTEATELKGSFDKGENIITVEVMNFLKDWLNNHIIGTDKKYGPFLNSKGVI